MEPEANKVLLRRYVEEVWTKRNPEAAYEFLAQSYQRHLSPYSEPLTLTGQVELLTGFQAAFPDARFTLDKVVAEDDSLCFRSTIHATHRGSFRSIAPTGNRVTIRLLDIIRVEDGRFTEQWGGPDVLDLLQQLGATVAPPTDA